MYYSLSTELYEELARRLAEAVADDDYFSGSVEFVFGDVECRFVASLIVYRRRELYPEGERRTIARLVPVWWEFHTLTPAGEVINDLDFTALCDLISSVA